MEYSNVNPVRCYNLTLDHFRQFPVWTWYDGPGADKEYEDSVIPVLLTEEGLNDVHDLLMIHAHLTLPDGQQYEGNVVIGLGSADVYCVRLWVDGVSHGFNKRSGDMADHDADVLRMQLGMPNLQIFPIRYSLLSDGLEVSSGLFDIDRNWNKPSPE